MLARVHRAAAQGAGGWRLRVGGWGGGLVGRRVGGEAGWGG